MTPSLCQYESLCLLVLLPPSPPSLSLWLSLTPSLQVSLRRSLFLVRMRARMRARSLYPGSEPFSFSFSFFLCVSLSLTLPLSSFSLPFLACFFPLALSFSLARSISLSLWLVLLLLLPSSFAGSSMCSEYAMQVGEQLHTLLHISDVNICCTLTGRRFDNQILGVWWWHCTGSCLDGPVTSLCWLSWCVVQCVFVRVRDAPPCWHLGCARSRVCVCVYVCVCRGGGEGGKDGVGMLSVCVDE